MNGTKRARNVQSITNRTSIYGVMAGLTPMTGKTTSVRSALQLGGNQTLSIPHPGLGPAPGGCPGGTIGRAYMMGCVTAGNAQGRYMLSKNPACSGGVGRKPVGVCNLGLRW